MKLKLLPLIWFFAFLIFTQVIWLEFRLNKFNQTSLESLLSQRQQEVKEKLAQVPEPEVEEKLAQGASLWLEPKEASFSGQFILEIWVQTDRPVKKADLRLFFPPQILKLVATDWLVDETVGLASWSGELDSQTNLEKAKLKSISFLVLKPGRAQIEFDFNKESLLDSNLIGSGGQDILEEVSGGDYWLN